MSLIVKMLSAEDAPDTDTRKAFILWSEVYDVHFKRADDGSAQMELQFEKGYEAEDVSERVTHFRSETFDVTGNVYVMNEAGKTIASFGPAPLDPALADTGVKLGRELAADIVNTLDALGLALVGHEHNWTVEERRAYELSVRALGGDPKRPHPFERKRRSR